ncbi:MAG: hypothetical protein CME60_14200 [Halobacteriovoraceae bacterium]|nr:hypothetical protein [Halobacteriovoraceae bacterium]
MGSVFFRVGVILSLQSSRSLYKKILYIVAPILIILSILSIGLYAWWSHLGEPQYSGEIQLLRLKEKVQVDYDKFGIPHIQASNEEDLYRALGLIMAQDRLFQMDLLRRVIRGEVSEVFGKAALEVDILFRSLGLIYGVQEKVANGGIDPRLKTLMDAFYDGVNQYIDRGNWPYEYKLLGMVPKKFDLLDGYGMLGYMSYSFAQSFKVDLLLDKIKREKGEDYTNSLRTRPLKKKTKRVSQKVNRHDSQIWQKAHLWLEENIGMFDGSNAWALSGKKSKSGKPILASDPHVQFSLPGIWYESVVDWGEGPFAGLFVPGVPFAAMGHNQHLGWGVTISYIDDMDFYREEIKGDNLHYKGQWLPMEKRHEVINIKGEADHELDLFWGVHGPILDKVHPLMEGKLAMKWGHFHEANQAPLAFYKMMNAKSYDEFYNALSLAKSPGLNIIYADAQGNIARFLFGSLPLRPEHMTGDLIYEGSEGLYEWLGDVEFDERAHLINPESGVIASANHRPVEGDYPGYYQPSDRYETIHSLLMAKDKWSLEENKYLQTSSTSILTFPVRDQILKAYELYKGKKSEEIRSALELLKKWDGRFNKESVAASLFQNTFLLTGKELLLPIKEYYLEYCDTNFYAQHVRKRTLRDNPYHEIRSAFEKTVAQFNNRFGDWSKAEWGQLHSLTISHPLSKGGKWLGKIFNLGPYPVSGAMDTINNLRRVGCREDHTVKAGPSSRRLIDFNRPQNSLAVLPTGNSGHWKSPFFSNQWELFKDGAYRESLLKGSLDKDERHSRLEITPKK